jgi:hypothetical protein
MRQQRATRIKHLVLLTDSIQPIDARFGEYLRSLSSTADAIVVVSPFATMDRAKRNHLRSILSDTGRLLLLESVGFREIVKAILC